MNYKGFTLIELLVVVAIIGILAAVGVVAYNGYTYSAKKAVVKSNWKTSVKYLGNEIAKCGMPCKKFTVPSIGSIIQVLFWSLFFLIPFSSLIIE